MAQDLKNTLLLPKTDFPMRGDLVKREPLRLEHWQKLDLYAAIQNHRADAPAFVLHDGPPFTNGDVHIGTALNKTLKDIVCRYKTMRGYRTPFVPGWDCHGLPIEQKVTREIQESGEAVSTAERRARCDAFSERWIRIQKEQFKRLGVQADWAHEYKTKDPAYEADIIRTFSSFVDQGIVFRSKKPVYWSVPFETALAESEIEYRDHTSLAIWVKFTVPASEAEKFSLPTDKPLSVVIWTTTPWTIPANLAIAVHPRADYVVADLGEERILVAAQLLPAVLETINHERDAPTVHTVTGDKLEHLATRHPLVDRASPIVLAEYVTTDSGTGCVHTAPGHGADDYITGLNYKLDIYCPVGDDGRYLDDGQVPADLVGLSTLETVEDLANKKPSTANIGVLKLLGAAGALLAKKKYLHSYPHCWRSKTPIIFRAVDQWFVTLDKAGHRTKALEEIGKVQWIPTHGATRIRGAVEARPDWCISRQRSWGVPIIAFFGADKTPYIDAGVIRAVADKIETRGTNFWYDATPAEILADVTLPEGWPAAADLVAGRDTLDVWIDSGSSHNAVLRNEQGSTSWPADLYLEGSDQHRGWFQSSLWTSVISRGSAPYKAVLTHGFIVGGDGKKISKSGEYEKPPTSDRYINDFGADVIRLWIASQDFTQDITLSDKILGNAGEAYRLFRNTFRYQLSTLFDFDIASHEVAVVAMHSLDRWALHQTAVLAQACTTAYDAYEFHRVYQLCNNFCSVTLSSIYHDILKDRLYTLAANDPLRRSSQTAIYHIYQTLVRLLAPVLTFTSDEAWAHSSNGTDFCDNTIHLQDWPSIPAEWTNAPIAAELATLFQIRSQVTEAIEPARQAGQMGKSLDAAVVLDFATDDESLTVLRKHEKFLPELFIVSQVTLNSTPTITAPTVTVSHCKDHANQRCPRCWRWVPELSSETCPRCQEALSSSA
jgi:isoleucyl-tRNA synthetase